VRRRLASAAFLGAAALAAGCASDAAQDAGERRAYVKVLEEKTLAELEAARPEARQNLARAAGWGVFGVGGASALGARTGVGFGVAHETKSRAETYLRAKDENPDRRGETFRAIVAFDDAAAFHRLVAEGWKFGATPTPGVQAWQFFDAGLADPLDLAGVTLRRDEGLDAGR
jgi:hypothetical protein